MFKGNIAFVLALLSLTAGIMLLLKVQKEEFCGKLWVKIAGYFIIVTSILSLLCTTYGVIYRWQNGYPMMRGRGWNNMVGGKNDMIRRRDCPMIKMMKNYQQQQNSEK